MEEYCKIADKLDLLPCPHCHTTGCLNRHGLRTRFDQKTGKNSISNARVYCNNRGNMRGCGRTYPVFLIDRLYGYIVSCQTLWAFLLQLLAGHTIKDAWESCNSTFCLDTGYKLRQAFIRNQPHIRTLLNRTGPPQNLNHISDPLLQTIRHMDSAFSSSSCPISAFHLKFETPFMV